MCRGVLSMLLLVGLVVVPLMLDAALAQEGKGPVPAEIGVNNHLFLRIRTPAAGFTVDQRRVLLERRLTEMFSCENTRSPDVRVGNIRGKPTIYVGETQLITVYPRDAEANKTTMEWLAAHWAERLRKALPHVGPTRSLKPPPE